MLKPVMESLLLSTDFDGTLIDHSRPADEVMAPEFFDWIEQERKRRRVVWAINTGRDWGSLNEELERRSARFWPDWVVLIEREIHRMADGELAPLTSWNHQCREIHADLFARADGAFAETRQRLVNFPNLQLVRDTGSPLGLIAADLDQAAQVEIEIQPLIQAFPEMHVVRNDIYFRFAHVDYHKGSCLGMLMAEEGIDAAHCFAAGDNANDLAMLDLKYAKHLACPSNSIESVKLRVREQGGYVADEPADRGIVQALRHFFP